MFLFTEKVRSTHWAPNNEHLLSSPANVTPRRLLKFFGKHVQKTIMAHAFFRRYWPRKSSKSWWTARVPLLSLAGRLVAERTTKVSRTTRSLIRSGSPVLIFLLAESRYILGGHYSRSFCCWQLGYLSVFCVYYSRALLGRILRTISELMGGIYSVNCVGYVARFCIGNAIFNKQIFKKSTYSWRKIFSTEK